MLISQTSPSKKELYLSSLYRSNRALEVLTENVIMNTVGVAASAQKPILAILGIERLASCVAIIVYDQEQKIGALMHLPDRIFFNNDFERLLRALIRCGDEAGGRSYYVLCFNVNNAPRPEIENTKILEMIQSGIEKLKREGKIIEVEFRDEQTFAFDTRIGTLIS